MGNIFTSYVIKGELKASTVKGGIETMIFLTEWYRANSGGKGVGFFQIAGGISGDFPICVVPMMYQDLEWEDTPGWAYFCQISDSTTSYGRRTQRENHLGQAAARYAEIHRRVGRHDRRSADFRLCARLVACP